MMSSLELISYSIIGLCLVALFLFFLFLRSKRGSMKIIDDGDNEFEQLEEINKKLEELGK